MSRQVDIPGGKATLRERGEVRQRDRRRLESASVMASPAMARIQAATKGGDPRDLNLSEVGLSREEFDSLYELQDATILAYLADWTLGRALPQNANDLGDLDADLYDALRTATASDGADTLAPVDFNPSPEPDRPTLAVTDSAGPSKENPAPQPASTVTSPSAGESTPIAASSPA